MTTERPAWVGFAVDAIAIIAAVVLVIVHAIPAREALAWIGLVQSGRLYVWATRSRQKSKELPSESGLLLLLLAVGELGRELFTRPHLPPS